MACTCLKDERRMSQHSPIYYRSNLSLRKATIKDSATVYSWRNLPEIVSLGKSQRNVEWEEHNRWFQQVVNGSTHLLFIIQLSEKAIGQIRFDLSAYATCE